MVYRFYMILIGEKKIEERKVIVVYHYRNCDIKTTFSLIKIN